MLAAIVLGIAALAALVKVNPWAMVLVLKLYDLLCFSCHAGQTVGVPVEILVNFHYSGKEYAPVFRTTLHDGPGNWEVCDRYWSLGQDQFPVPLDDGKFLVANVFWDRCATLKDVGAASPLGGLWYLVDRADAPEMVISGRFDAEKSKSKIDRSIGDLRSISAAIVRVGEVGRPGNPYPREFYTDVGIISVPRSRGCTVYRPSDCPVTLFGTLEVDVVGADEAKNLSDSISVEGCNVTFERQKRYRNAHFNAYKYDGIWRLGVAQSAATDPGNKNKEAPLFKIGTVFLSTGDYISWSRDEFVHQIVNVPISVAIGSAVCALPPWPHDSMAAVVDFQNGEVREISPSSDFVVMLDAPDGG